MKSLAFVLLASIFLAGCPVSKDPYTASMQASLAVSDSVAQAIPIVQELQTANLITAEESKAVYGYLLSVTSGNQGFRVSIKSFHAAGTGTASAYLLAANTFVTSVNSSAVLAAIHISNPAAQARVMLYLNAIGTVLNGIATAIQNNTVTPAPAPILPTGAFLWTRPLSLI